MSAPGRNLTNGSGPGSGRQSDVSVVRWPGDAERAGELFAGGALVLFLVEPEADAPILDDHRADWIRLPAEERDVAARVLGLTRRYRLRTEAPYVDEHGRLFYCGRWVSLSPIEARLAAALGNSIGTIVSTEELARTAWSEEDRPPPQASSTTLRVHLTRLRRRLEPLGLEVRSVRRQGLVMQARESRLPN